MNLVSFMRGAQLAALAAACLLSLPAAADQLGRTIPAVKAAVVGIGTYQRVRSPALVWAGTGFVVGDGLSVITNSHTVPELLDTEKMETLCIVLAKGEAAECRPAQLAGRDREHDLAHLRLTGAPLPVLQLGEPELIAEGRELAVTGFPLGMVLGLHHVTHRAMLAAITPVVMPSLSSQKLDPRTVAQLKRTPFDFYQLDCTAYPGNSGSPVYDPDSGVVLGVVNMVGLRGLKESAISQPSGITYAVPVRYVRELLQRKSP